MNKIIRKCPKCRSTDLKNSLLLSAQEISLVSNVLMPDGPETYFCKKCKYFGPVLKTNKN